MPRISPLLVREARRLSPLLPPILRAVPSVAAAYQELRWIKQELPPSQWKQAAMRRGRNEPLQYILGTQPFGELLIDCIPGVLIPRWETEEWCNRLAACLVDQSLKSVSILDACTGTGCIPLLLSHMLATEGVDVRAIGFDTSPVAYEAGVNNLAKYRESFSNVKANISFRTLDLFDPAIISKLDVSHVDVLTSNPPYIPLGDYFAPVLRNGVQRSVRQYEPKLALVGDLEFYTALVNSILLPSKSKVFVFELGYIHQAKHVQNLLKDSEWTCDLLYDSAGNIRCVYGWNSLSNLTLKDL